MTVFALKLIQIIALHTLINLLHVSSAVLSTMSLRFNYRLKNLKLQLENLDGI